MKAEWISLSLIAWLSFAIIITILNFLTKRNLSASFLLFCVSLIYAIIYGIQSFVFKQFPNSLSFNLFFLIIIVGIIGALGNLSQLQAVKISPNPGLVIAIVGTYAGLVTILSYMLFKNNISFLQVLGIVLSIVSILLINLGSTQK